ncbi:helix-turn-helix domain-containing protein, partial [Neisseria meningitidis]|uniref:helix-turn-helix domain-containing protein n=2 Tax=Neisseria meningitidis TaxID=487 RepID=UPI00214B83F2
LRGYLGKIRRYLGRKQLKTCVWVSAVGRERNFAKVSVFKFEIIPNDAQIRKMKQFCGCSRFVFNQALAWQNEQYGQDNSVKFSYTKIANLLPE